MVRVRARNGKIDIAAGGEYVDWHDRMVSVTYEDLPELILRLQLFWQEQQTSQQDWEEDRRENN